MDLFRLHFSLYSKARGLVGKGVSFQGGEEIKPGTLHGGEEIKPGTLHGGEEIKPGTLHSSELTNGDANGVSYSPATYRVKDGSNTYYEFEYVWVGSFFEIDIKSQPSYKHRSSSDVKVHRIDSHRGGKQICIGSGHEPTTIDKAKKISMEWAELTHMYIKTGKSIDAQVRENAYAPSESREASNKFWNWLNRKL